MDLSTSPFTSVKASMSARLVTVTRGTNKLLLKILAAAPWIRRLRLPGLRNQVNERLTMNSLFRDY